MIPRPPPQIRSLPHPLSLNPIPTHVDLFLDLSAEDIEAALSWPLLQIHLGPFLELNGFTPDIYQEIRTAPERAFSFFLTGFM